MRPLLGNEAVLQHDDLVAVDDGRQAVRNRERGAALGLRASEREDKGSVRDEGEDERRGRGGTHKLAQAVLDEAFVVRVEGRSCEGERD